jgi:hypothetical protein
MKTQKSLQNSPFFDIAQMKLCWFVLLLTDRTGNNSNIPLLTMNDLSETDE